MAKFVKTTVFLLGMVAGCTGTWVYFNAPRSHQAPVPVMPLPVKNSHVSALPLPKSSPFMLSLPEFYTWVERGDGMILDARPAWEYQAGHVPRARSLPLEDFEKAYDLLRPQLESNKSQPVVIYCSQQGCKTGWELRKKLIVLGFTNVFLFPKGWSAWQEAGMPEEKP